jgi:tetratricopeptide (TPR) repeat protein
VNQDPKALFLKLPQNIADGRGMVHPPNVTPECDHAIVNAATDGRVFMDEWPPRAVREEALRKTNALLAEAPLDVKARFHRCCLLTELGRTDEAKSAYLELLLQEPDHFGALNNLGNLVYGQGFRSAAITLYSRAVQLHPTNPKGHVNLANVLAQNNQIEKAEEHYRAALRLDPHHIEANRGLAFLLTRLRDEEQAAIHRKKGYELRPTITFPYRGEGRPINVLLLASASGGTIPMRHHLDENTFQTTALFVEFYDRSTPLPPCDLVFNTIGDADLCGPALQAAAAIAAGGAMPVINHPEKVLLTGRRENSRRLGQIEGVITPKMSLISKEMLQKEEAAKTLQRMGLKFPFLLRPPGFHTGRHFVRVENVRSLAAEIAGMPGEELLAIEYLDSRKPDGKIRKCRVMMIDGVLYPLHLAVARDWKIHYFTAEMADHPEHRAQDAAFLQDMPGVLGPKAMNALHEICRTMCLEYCGIDFSLNDEKDILLFEANATMVVNPPEPDRRWDYRRPAVARILDAIQRLLTKHGRFVG